MACVKDESRLSFSARSSGRYLVSSIVFPLCAVWLDSVYDTVRVAAFSIQSFKAPVASLASPQTKLQRCEVTAMTRPGVCGSVLTALPQVCPPSSVALFSSMDKGEMAQLRLSVIGGRSARR